MSIHPKFLARMAGMLVCAAGTSSPAQSAPLYGYAEGYSTENTVVPGSVVTVDGFLRNTGSLPIAVTQNNGVFVLPTPDGLSFIGPTFNLIPAYFDPAPELSTQFNGVEIAPGETFPFIFGTFHVPDNLPLGTTISPISHIGIEIFYTFSVFGTNRTVIATSGGPTDGGGQWVPFETPTDPVFRLGLSPERSDPIFFDGIVFDRFDIGKVYSGGEFVAFVPEPAILALLGLAFSAMCWARRRNSREGP